MPFHGPVTVCLDGRQFAIGPRHRPPPRGDPGATGARGRGVLHVSCRSCPSCPSRTPSPSDACPGKLLLVGNPNVGKSALFSRLTGTHALSSNYPGTTVGFLEGRLIHGDRCYRLVDVPGSYTLAATNEAEEIASRIVDEGARRGHPGAGRHGAGAQPGVGPGGAGARAPGRWWP